MEPAVERENRKVRGSRSLLSRVSDPFFFNFFILLNLDPGWFSGSRTPMECLTPKKEDLDFILILQ